MPTNRHVDAWGAYRPAIEDHLAACADYLGRLERSLAGEIAPDRHYFSDKAHQLHQSARRLERLVQDTDRWLAGCHAMVEHRYEDGTRSLGECELPAGHDGDHDGDPARLAGETLCVRARDGALHDAAFRPGGLRAGGRRTADQWPRKTSTLNLVSTLRAQRAPSIGQMTTPPATGTARLDS